MAEAKIEISELAELKEMVAKVVATNKELSDKNIALEDQLKSIQKGGAPSRAEQERQRKIVAKNSKRKLPGNRPHEVIIEIRPEGKKDDKGKPVVWKTKPRFRTGIKPETLKDSKTVAPGPTGMILADYNNVTPARLTPENATVKVA